MAEVGVLELVVRAKLTELDKDLATTKAKASKAAGDMGNEMESKVGAKLGGVGDQADKTSRRIGGIGTAIGGVAATMASAGIASKLYEAGDASRVFADKVSGAASIIDADYQALATQAKSFRFIPPSVAAEAQQQFAVVAAAMGMTGDRGVELQGKLLETAQAMTVVTGIPIGEITTGIAAAFRGEYDSLQRLIPGINAATIETAAMAATGKTSAAALTDQEKAQAVLTAVLGSGAEYAGKMAENTGTAAAKQKEAAAASDLAAISLGDKLQPAMAKVSEIAGKVAGFFAGLPGPVQTAVIAMMGIAVVAGPLTSVIGLFGVLKGAMVAHSLAAGATGAASAASSGGFFAAAAGLWAMMAPIMPFVLIAGALVAVGLLIWKNWDSIWALGQTLFGWIGGAASAAVGFLKDNFLYLLGPIGFLIKHWDDVWELGQKLFGWIAGAASAALSFLKDNFLYLLGPIGILIKHWDTLKEAAGKAVDWILDKVQGLIDFITDLPGKIGRGLAGLADALKGPFKAGLNGVIWLLNRFIDVATAPLKLLNNIPGLGSVIPDIPRIPELDSGGIVNRPTLALLAANSRPEAVIPLDRMGSMGGDDGGPAGGIVIHVAGSIVTERQLASILTRHQDATRRHNGKQVA